ncbi:MAG: c-type cytochrome biogenesis protein CcmI [Rhizobacter sp.]|nr:c-type cytochrome biogenesis protein CcmI [Rhizobacter sp.]
MTVFWVASAGLLVLALGLLLPTLFRERSVAESTRHGSARQANLAILRDQLRQLDAELAAGSLDAEQHRLSRLEIERRVLEEESVEERPASAGPARKTALALLLTLPLFTIGAYALFGNVSGLDPAAAVARVDPAGEITLPQVEEMVEKLARRLESQTTPQASDLEGWTMLARSYSVLQRFDDASRAFARAIALSPNDAQLLADRADVMGAAQGQKLAGEPMRLIERALQIDPRNAKALALAGSAAYEHKDFAAAVRHWSDARQIVPADSDFGRGLDSSIADARAAAQRSGATVSATAAPAAASGAAAAALPGAQVSGRVSLAPALAARAAPTDTVFIFARAAEGPRVPLAVLRHTVAELPIDFTLDDSMAMSPQMKLSAFPLVVVGARVSKSGNAMPQSGDLQGQAASVKLGSKGIDLVIDSVQP